MFVRTNPRNDVCDFSYYFFVNLCADSIIMSFSLKDMIIGSDFTRAIPGYSTRLASKLQYSDIGNLWSVFRLNIIGPYISDRRCILIHLITEDR